jgi:hypothetical protein
MAGTFPEYFREPLVGFLSHFRYPLAVRSSSLLEDAQFRAYAGLYKTYMLPNDDSDTECRLQQLINAIKMVFASTYFQGPKAFSKRVGSRTEEERMAVIVQKLVGDRHSNYFYPAISGVAQSHNYYPYSRMRPEDGIATIALGLGKAVMEGEKALRFSPRHPELALQYADVKATMDNAQRFFFSLELDKPFCELGVNDALTLAKREIMDAADEPPVKTLTSVYVRDEHRIVDAVDLPGYRVATFAPVLKYDLFPLADLLNDLLAIGREGMGYPVELEFSVELNFHDSAAKPRFAILQLRPMSARLEMMNVDISTEDIEKAFCFSGQALGNTVNRDMADIVFVKPEAFDPGQTPRIAREIGEINAALCRDGRKYVLIGPGRWGSADRWLGIPVTWADIGGVGAIVETIHPNLNAEPSQGSHFFHNLTSLGINYLTVNRSEEDWIDWKWLSSLPRFAEKTFVAHVSLDHALTLKVDGRKSQGVIIYEEYNKVTDNTP